MSAGLTLAVPAAHAGHWLTSIAFALPPVVLIGLLVGAGFYARRHHDPGSDPGTGTTGEAQR